MASRWVRRSTAALVVALALGTQSAAAGAGGGDWLDPARDRYEPGQRVTMIGYGVLAGVEAEWRQTAYHAFLRRPSIDEVGDAPLGDDLGWPGLPLGRVIVEEVEPHWGNNGRVSVEFSLPDDLTPGLYIVDVCTAGCGAPLGWFYPSTLHVGVDPASPVVRNWPLSDPALRWLEDDALLGTASGVATAADVRAGRVPEPAVNDGVPNPGNAASPTPTTSATGPVPGADLTDRSVAPAVADGAEGPSAAVGGADNATDGRDGTGDVSERADTSLLVGGAALALAAAAAGGRWAVVARAHRTRGRSPDPTSAVVGDRPVVPPDDTSDRSNGGPDDTGHRHERTGADADPGHHAVRL